MYKQNLSRHYFSLFCVLAEIVKEKQLVSVKYTNAKHQGYNIAFKSWSGHVESVALSKHYLTLMSFCVQPFCWLPQAQSKCSPDQRFVCARSVVLVCVTHLNN